MAEKSAFIVFLGNIKYDSRCHNLFNSLKDQNYIVSALGFDWVSPEFQTTKSGSISVYKLDKKSGSIFFYLKFSIITLVKLLTTRHNLYFAEDIYTLPFVVIIAKLKRGRIIYDAREIFGSLAGLVGKKSIQKTLSVIESYFIKKADIVLTTGEMDAEHLRKSFNISNIIVIRNLPVSRKPVNIINYPEYLNLPGESRFLLYHGVILHGRGLKNIYKALKKLSGYYLIVIGDGEQKEYYQKLAVTEGVDEKVKFIGRIEQDYLYNYTAGGTVGISLIENLSLSYYYALPNKLFEYILCELPVIVSNLPQMKEIVDKYDVGFYVEEDDIDDFINKLKLLEDKTIYQAKRENCKRASLELNWNKEIQKLLEKL